MYRINHKSSSALAIISILIASLMVFSFGCVKKEEKEIKIGAILALTGKAASYGDWARKGITLATEQLNQSGSVKINILQEDSQGDPKIAVSAMEKLISVNKVPVIIGFITSSEFLACAPLAEKNKVLMITPVAGAPLERKDGSYVFRTRESGVSQSKIVSDYVFNTLKIKKASVLYENAANAIAYKDVFEDTFRSHGGQIVQSLSYDEGQTDYRSILTKIKSNPGDAVYIPGVGKVIGHILVQAKELGVKTRFFSSAGIEDPELFRIAGETANGIIFGAPAFSLESEETHVHKFVESYRKRFNEEPSVYAANAYDAMMLVGEAIKFGKKTPNEIKDHLYSVADYKGASGKISFERNGEVNKPVILKITQNGQFLPL
jgi:branched-chain amino acid transport system substrate-binding protein